MNMIKKVINIWLCMYALFGTLINGMTFLVFSLQDIVGCIIHFFPYIVFKNLFVVINMLIAVGIKINVKSIANTFLFVMLFLISGYYLIDDVMFTFLYETSIYGFDNKFFYVFKVIPCLLRVICYLICIWYYMKRWIFGRTKQIGGDDSC
jgi:hypothetical protein